MVSCIAAALAKHDSPKSQAFIRKIDTITAKICYALTSHIYTAGQVSDQRSEGGMSTIKANGKLKRRLQEGTYSETMGRISQVSRDSNIASFEELVRCREASKKVGSNYELALGNAKALVMKLYHVEPASELNKYMVKGHSNSSEFCLVDIRATIMWRGQEFQIITGTCSYNTCARIICPCACATLQRLNLDIDDISHVHSCFRIMYHPPWQEALNTCRLPDYDDSPNVLTDNHPMGSGDKTVRNLTGSGQSTNDIIRKVNGDIFDKLGDFEKYFSCSTH